MSCDRVTPDTPLASQFDVSKDEFVRFIMSRKPAAEYPAHSVGEIVGHYIDIGAEARIAPLFAIAQMCHETGYLTSWWSGRPRRNPAGIGVTGHTLATKTRPGLDWVWHPVNKVWAQGYTFETWRDSALAHYGHLLAYMLTDVELAMDGRKHIVACDPRAKAIPVRNRGAVTALRDLNGRWAVPGTTYADKIASIANAILGE